MRQQKKAQKSRSFVRFALNGILHEVSGSDSMLMFADYLRKKLHLTGTKIVCAEGDCGACTVLRAQESFGSQSVPSFSPINSCIALVAQLDGSHLVTVEALADNGKMSPIQEAMVACHGSQCGYCTPGFVMCLTSCLENSKHPPDEQKIKNHLTGNLCRCTGYTPIIEAAQTVDITKIEPLTARFIRKDLRQALRKDQKVPITISTGDMQFFAPTTLEHAGTIWKQHPEARVLASGTDLGVQINKGKLAVGSVISLHLIPELYKTKKRGHTLSFGAKVSLTKIHDICEAEVPEFAKFLNIFASPQIKNIGTLVGNIANASPIGDTLPFLLVADGTVVTATARSKLTSLRGSLPISELFVGYRKLALKPGELIASVSFRAPKKDEFLKLYKSSTRKDLDISTVSAAFLLELKLASDRTCKIVAARIALGGVAAMPLRIGKLEDFLIGKTLTKSLVDGAGELLQQEIKPLSDVRGTSAFRRVLINNFFQQYMQDLAQERGVVYA